ncbi:hypothetical protein [Aquitalea magnusonii]|nr:hypothetical protein [Aquitalea magnusonii]
MQIEWTGRLCDGAGRAGGCAIRLGDAASQAMLVLPPCIHVHQARWPTIKGPDFTMNHSFIRTALLLGALLLGGFAHAETEDIPLPGDVQSAPLKSAKKSAHHAPASQAHAAGAQRKASKPASRKHHAAGKKHHRQHGKHAAAAKHKPASKMTGKKNAAKPVHHKTSKNNKLAKKPVRRHKKMH